MKQGTGRGDDGDTKPGKPAENWGKEIAGCEGVKRKRVWAVGMAGQRQGGGGRFEGFQKRVRVAATRFRNWGNMRGRCLNNLGPRSHGVLWAVAVTGARLSVGEFELGTM